MQTDYSLMMATRSADLGQHYEPHISRPSPMHLSRASGVGSRRRYASYVAAANVITAVVGGSPTRRWPLTSPGGVNECFGSGDVPTHPGDTDLGRRSGNGMIPG